MGRGEEAVEAGGSWRERYIDRAQDWLQGPILPRRVSKTSPLPRQVAHASSPLPSGWKRKGGEKRGRETEREAERERVTCTSRGLFSLEP